MRMLAEFVNGNPPGSVVTSENVTLGGAHLSDATVTLKYADDEGLPSSKPNITFEVKTAGGMASIAADFEAYARSWVADQVRG